MPDSPAFLYYQILFSFWYWTDPMPDSPAFWHLNKFMKVKRDIVAPLLEKCLTQTGAWNLDLN
jgi:hypothetical protein